MRSCLALFLEKGMVMPRISILMSSHSSHLSLIPEYLFWMVE